MNPATFQDRAEKWITLVGTDGHEAAARVAAHLRATDDDPATLLLRMIDENADAQRLPGR
jgi:hypothetical protein